MEALARPMPTRGPPAETEDDYALFLAAMRPTPRERRVAYALIIGLTAAFLVTAAFGDRLLPRLDGFIPTVQAIMCVFYLVTAVLLYGQFAVEPRRSLLAISSGYLLAALAMAVNTLTFPGVYSPTGLLGAGLQTAAWLYYFLYTGFALAIIAYALLKTKDEKAGVLRGSPRIVIAWSILGVVVLVGGWTLFVIAGEDLLPRLLLDPVRVTPTVRFLSSALVVLNFGALILLWSRQRSVLGLWLMVTLVGDLSIIALPIIFYFVRYSLGWYASRLYAVGAAGTLLAVLATETTSLYARLARAMRAQQRDRRDRLMSVEAATAALAHEIRQPLSEITLKSQVALRALKSRPPDLARAQHAGQDAVEACMRASETITGVLRMFRRNTAQSQIVEINDVVREVIDAVSHDARARGVVVLTDLREGLPPLLGDRAQLHQVVANLVSNAFDAMATVTGRPRNLRVSTSRSEDGGVQLAVEDSGRGIDPKHEDRIFEPFFTTKSTGLGLGLSICRSIVERHGGRLRARRGAPHGTVFFVELPAADRSAANTETEKVVNLQ